MIQPKKARRLGLRVIKVIKGVFKSVDEGLVVMKGGLY